MIILGLTGSIGMGKSTTAKMFAAEGAAVYDADAAVHSLYAGKAAPLIESAFPGTVKDGVVDRTALGKIVLGDAKAMKRLEAIIHPLVRSEEKAFLLRSRNENRAVAVIDSPLLLETGGDVRVDAVVVVSADAQTQKQRVLARPGMDEEKLDSILSKQMSDADKRKKAHFIVDTSKGMEAAERAVKSILRSVAANA
ncbi:dephospho-CoA kinase [Rhodobacteraceae bacterium RKSG542]|uniref:dephospho-CoA kinase n=1 Tax=Pseudovibrio flavus TaxID=2529854 RepID=UPI0012BC02E9|nr:dephospho-CoA kinase [Pseudovibrio flavus]MTI18481.1 dephospho-CoA kinase [Pseudovibrio flavus]